MLILSYLFHSGDGYYTALIDTAARPQTDDKNVIDLQRAQVLPAAVGICGAADLGLS